jgi:hypothetical protein
MSRDPDPCLKPFIAYDRQDKVAFKEGLGLGNSCWVDSLFVALFHTNNIKSIRQFIDELKIKKYLSEIHRKKYITKEELERMYENSTKTTEDMLKILEIKQYGKNTTINISDNDIQQLQKYEEEIIDYIKYIYFTINFNDNELKKRYVCYNFRIKLENHRQILINNNIFSTDKSFESFKDLNNPMQLLQYLKEYILDTECFNNILIETIVPENYHDEDQDLNKYLKNLLPLKYIDKDIIFINIQYSNLHNSGGGFFNNQKNNIEENFLDLFLHSIIVHLGLHYTCYYKCNDRWYYYNDVEPIEKRTILVGDFNAVKKHHNKIFSRKENDYELMFLYLKNNVEQEADEEHDKQIVKELDFYINKQKGTKLEGDDKKNQSDRMAELKMRLELEKKSEDLAKKLEKEDSELAAARDHEQTTIIIGEKIDIDKQFDRYKELVDAQLRKDTKYLQQAARSEKAIEKERETEELEYQRALQLSQEESDFRTALQIEKREKQEKSDHEYAKSLRKQYGGGIRIINDRCNATIKNINDSNCNQKLEKIQKIQYGRDQLIKDMNKFFNKKFLIDKK